MIDWPRGTQCVALITVLLALMRTGSALSGDRPKARHNPTPAPDSCAMIQDPRLVGFVLRHADDPKRINAAINARKISDYESTATVIEAPVVALADDVL